MSIKSTLTKFMDQSVTKAIARTYPVADSLTAGCLDKFLTDKTKPAAADKSQHGERLCDFICSIVSPPAGGGGVQTSWPRYFADRASSPRARYSLKSRAVRMLPCAARWRTIASAISPR